MIKRSYVSAQLDRQRGVSLVELMIGMLIGLIMLAGIILVFTSSNEVNRSRMALSAISDNGRFVIEHMNRHLRMAVPGSISLSGYTLNATLISGESISYTLKPEDSEIMFEIGGVEVTLVDGVNDWELLFGVGNRIDQTLGYKNSATSSDEILSLRVNLILEDPTNQGSPLEIANNHVGSTIALRNPLLLAMSGNNSPNATPGSAEQVTPGEPGDNNPPGDNTPPGGSDNGDAPNNPPSDDADTNQPLPSQPVVCVEQTKTVTVTHHNYGLTSSNITEGVGEFLGCSTSGTTRTCTGKASTSEGFLVALEFSRPGNHPKITPELFFSCTQ